MARLDVWRPCLRLGREVALLAVLCAVAGFGAVAFAGEPSPGPGQSMSRPAPAIKIQPRSFEELTPQERVASYNAAWLKVEPDRMVPAEKWKSPYCLEWDDACTRCSRPDAASNPICRPINASESANCKSKIIQCSGASVSVMQSICAVDQSSQGPNSNGNYYISACEAYFKDLETGEYIFDCRYVGNVNDIYKDRPSNIPDWPGYGRFPSGALALSVPEGILPRDGKQNLYCIDPRKDDGGWVIDKLRPAF
jgi:hypothetical protein